MAEFAVMRWTNDGNRLSVHNLKWVVEPKDANYKVGTEGIARYSGYPGLWKFRILRIGEKKMMQQWLDQNITSLLEDTTDSLYRENMPNTSPNKPPEKSPMKRPRSPEKSPKRSRSPEKSPKRSRSPEKSPKRSRSPEKSPKRSRSPEKSPKRSRSPEKSPKRSRSPEKSLKRSRSPEKSQKRSRSIEKSSSNKLKSPKKTLKSPKKILKSPKKILRSPEKSPKKRVRSPEKSPKKSERTPKKRQRSHDSSSEDTSPQKRQRTPDKSKFGKFLQHQMYLGRSVSNPCSPVSSTDESTQKRLLRLEEETTKLKKKYKKLEERIAVLEKIKSEPLEKIKSEPISEKNKKIHVTETAELSEKTKTEEKVETEQSQSVKTDTRDITCTIEELEQSIKNVNGDNNKLKCVCSKLFTNEELIHCSRTGKKTAKSGDNVKPALNSEKFELLKMVVCKHTAFETNEIIKKFENIQKILRRNLKKCQ